MIHVPTWLVCWDKVDDTGSQVVSMLRRTWVWFRLGSPAISSVVFRHTYIQTHSPTHTYTHTHLYTHTDTYTYKAHTHIQTNIHTHTRARTHMKTQTNHTHTHINARTHTHTHTHTHANKHTQARAHAQKPCTHTQILTLAYKQHTHTCKHTHTHTHTHAHTHRHTWILYLGESTYFFLRKSFRSVSHCFMVERTGNSLLPPNMAAAVLAWNIKVHRKTSKMNEMSVSCCC